MKLHHLNQIQIENDAIVVHQQRQLVVSQVTRDCPGDYQHHLRYHWHLDRLRHRDHWGRVDSNRCLIELNSGHVFPAPMKTIE